MKRQSINIAGQQTAVLPVLSLQARIQKKGFNWREIVACFAASQSGVRNSSRALYTRTLSLYFKWIEDTGRTLSEMTIIDIEDYKRYLFEERHLKALTVSSYIVAVRKLYEWVEANKLGANIAKGVKTPKRQQDIKEHLSDKKSAELLSHFENLSLRDFAIVNLILRTGLRTIEVVRANVEDVTIKTKGDESRRVLKVWGKGRAWDDKEREFVILSDKAYLPIKNYLAARKNVKPGEPLFVSESRQNAGKRLTTRTISGICKEGLRAIGLDSREYTAHSLRHTTACAILKHGGSITDVQDVLRHASIDTSRIYLKSIAGEQRFRKPIEFCLDTAF